MRSFAIMVLTALLLGIFAPAASADVTLGISPMKLEYRLKPGDSTTETVKAFNPGSAGLHVTTLISDYQVDTRGVPQFDSRDKDPFAAANWMEVSPSEFNLTPGETKLVQIQVKVPKDAAPGGHYGAVLFQFGGGTSTGTGVGVSGRIAAINLITVPGAVKRAGALQQVSIPFLSSGYPVPISLSVANSGNIHLPLDGNIDVSNWLGGKVDSIPIPEGYVFPNSTKNLYLTMNGGSMFGFYRADVIFNDKSITGGKTPCFIVFPWPLVLGVMLAAFGLYKLGLTRGRKGKASPGGDNPP